MKRTGNERESRQLSGAKRRHGTALALVLWAGVLACGGGQQNVEPPPDQPKSERAEDILARAIAAEEAGQPGEADEQYRRALTMRPADLDSNRRYVQFLITQDRAGDAIKVARAFTEREPASMQGKHLLADALMGAGEFAKAIEELTIIIELDEDASAIDKRGRARLLGGDLEGAIVDLRKAVAVDPDNVPYLVSLGSALHQAGKLDEAALHLRNALRLDDTSDRGHRIIGIVLREQMNYTEAVAHHLKAAKHGPDDHRNHFELGVSQNYLGDDLASEQSLARAVELAPENATNWYAYGEILRMLERWPDSVRAYRKTLELEPRHAKAGKKLAVVLYHAGEVGEAELRLTEAIREDPKDPYPYFNLGLVYAAQEKYRLAIATLQKFLELAPRDDGDVPTARAKIRELRRKVR